MYRSKKKWVKVNKEDMRRACGVNEKMVRNKEERRRMIRVIVPTIR